MGKFLKNFDSHSDYNTYITGNDKKLPNLSYCKNENEVHYNPWKGIIATYNVNTISAATTILYNTTGITEMYVDGVRQPSVSTTFKFANTGIHTVRYTYESSSIASKFRTCQRLVSVICSNTITALGEYPFYSCKLLKSFKMTNTIASWGEYAFQACSAIESIGPVGSGADIELSNKLPNVTSLTFNGCTGLKTVVLPANIYNLNQRCFNGCTSLTSFTLLRPTPPTYQDRALNNTNNCPIYVPADSVAAYKAASGWSALADRIQAIP